MNSRRDTLKHLVAIGTLAAVPSASGQDAHLPDAHASDQSGYEHSPYKAPAIPPYAPQTFSAAEGAIVSRIVDLMIPATDTPGALAAGVPQYIDHVAATNSARHRVIVEGLAWIEAQSRSVHDHAFVELEPEQQIALLTAAENDTERAPFFRAMKDLTVDGYYTSYSGLVEELGYRGNQMLASFPGCTHDHEL